ncbi:hypothetical protein [Lysobacter gummosus]
MWPRRELKLRPAFLEVNGLLMTITLFAIWPRHKLCIPMRARFSPDAP